MKKNFRSQIPPRIKALREKHGFKVGGSTGDRLKGESRQAIKAMLASGTITYLDEYGEEKKLQVADLCKEMEDRLEDRKKAELEALPFVPGNAPILLVLERKFRQFGFAWTPEKRVIAGKSRNFVTYTNFPLVAGVALTFVELLTYPIESFDGFKVRVACPAINLTADLERMAETVRVMDSTGLGYKGLSGTSWLPGTEPMRLAPAFFAELQRLAHAVFCFFEVVANLYERDTVLKALLNHKRPDHIMPLLHQGSGLGIIRPDIVIMAKPDGTFQPVLTELESCPAGQGMTHAMQIGYGLPTEMVDRFIEFLEGRPFVVVATSQWSEYVFEQATFVRALRERGVDARMIFDAPLSEIDLKAKELWLPPDGLSPELRATWRTDFLVRLGELGFADFITGTSNLPENVGNAVVFRFGYFDNFSAETLQLLAAWEAQGAAVINPLQFPLENKGLMAAINLPSVQEELTRLHGPEVVEVLKRCVAETRIVDPDFTDLNELERDQAYWLTKFGAWDGKNKSWGSRSLVFGPQVTQGQWRNNLQEMRQLPHPVVAQHIIASQAWRVGYSNGNGTSGMLENARVRLTPFFVRKADGDVLHCGSTVTFRQGTLRIHGASDAVEMPVVFEG